MDHGDAGLTTIQRALRYSRFSLKLERARHITSPHGIMEAFGVCACLASYFPKMFRNESDVDAAGCNAHATTLAIACPRRNITNFACHTGAACHTAPHTGPAKQ